MGKRKGKKISFTDTEMKEANVDAHGTSHEAETSNKLVSIEDLKDPSGQQLMEDVKWFETNNDPQHISLAVPLPDTPIKPPPKKGKFGGGEDAEILEAIRMLSVKHDETFRAVSAIKTTTESTSKHLEKLTATVQHLTREVSQQKQTVDDLKNVTKKLQSENKMLKADIAECQRYSRRWSLKVHGVKEEEGEDIRRKIIDILGNTASKLRSNLDEGLDIVHRVGQRRQDGSSRSVIVLFALRRLRDAIWREAKGSKFLLDKKLRISEALSPEDKAAREKLWPLVKKAREEGKKASFRGPFVFINGRKIDPSEVT